MENTQEVRVRQVKYKTFSFNVAADKSPEEIREELSEVFPEIATASFHDDEDGALVFTLKSGEKGI